METPAVCVVGAANLDLISYVPRLPREGETLHGTEFRIGYGGKGANQAVMAAKLGARVTMVTKLGEDVFGEGTLENFKQYGIDTTHVLRTPQAFSGVAPIAVDQQGRNSIIIVTGANDLLTIDEVRGAENAIVGSGVTVCQLEIPLEISVAALMLARDAGVPTVFNPAPAREQLPADAYRLADVFCPNESEATLLTGKPVSNVDQARVAADVLLERGATSVVLTLGANGCLIVGQQGATHLPGEQVDAIDSTGAGDAFVGSLAFFLASGYELVDAARRSNRIAAVSVTGRGTQTSFPDAADLPDDLFSWGAGQPARRALGPTRLPYQEP